METITREDTDLFYQKTGLDITVFFVNYATFVDRYYTGFSDFYIGKKNVSVNTFIFFDNLLKQVDFISNKIYLTKESLGSYSDWKIIEKFEEIKHSIETIKNISKYLRSSILPDSYRTNPYVMYVLKQGETLEMVSKNVLFDQQWQNNWSDIALDNLLNEEKYTPEGGVSLILEMPSNFAISNIQTVIDNLNFSNIYGKDIARKLEFIDNDLNTLNPSETLLQSVNILVNLKKGNNPQYPDDGIDKTFIVGSNLNSFSFPSIFRQLQEVLKTDDAITGLNVIELKQEQDTIRFSFEILTVTSEQFKNLSFLV